MSTLLGTYKSHKPGYDSDYSMECCCDGLDSANQLHHASRS
jgi:hypothetical protein